MVGQISDLGSNMCSYGGGDRTGSSLEGPSREARTRPLRAKSFAALCRVLACARVRRATTNRRKGRR
jgi:hypothetical protein